MNSWRGREGGREDRYTNRVWLAIGTGQLLGCSYRDGLCIFGSLHLVWMFLAWLSLHPLTFLEMCVFITLFVFFFLFRCKRIFLMYMWLKVLKWPFDCQGRCWTMQSSLQWKTTPYFFSQVLPMELKLPMVLVQGFPPLPAHYCITHVQRLQPELQPPITPSQPPTEFEPRLVALLLGFHAPEPAQRLPCHFY